eukprot:6208188-Pleurochrysis_carterae.AAC.5
MLREADVHASRGGRACLGCRRLASRAHIAGTAPMKETPRPLYRERTPCERTRSAQTEKRLLEAVLACVERKEGRRSQKTRSARAAGGSVGGSRVRLAHGSGARLVDGCANEEPARGRVRTGRLPALSDVVMAG